MGEVYRARDSRLKRDVALKVITPAFAADADRLARFQREAEMLAALNHPHIAAIHGIEETGSVTALVLELVQGETLAERLAHGALPVHEAVLVARQVADALDAAHERGIIHRDLKPANIKITPDGVVKVLDFGLAKLTDASTSAAHPSGISLSPTITSPALTAAGVILGTAAYMSPEQARGRAVDRRTDIWALGCILFEMLTGSRAFAGDTVSDVIASVLKSEPDYSALPPVSPRLRALVQRSLDKDPKKRWRDAGDLRLELESVGDGTAAVGDVNATSRVASRERAVWLGALVVTAALAVLVPRFWNAKSDTVSTASQGVLRFGLSPAAGTALYAGGWIVPFSLSPDSKWIAYTATSDDGQSRLWLRAFDADAGQPVAGSEGAVGPFWSPDSAWVGFHANGTMHRVRVPGGSPEPITVHRTYTNTGLNATWGKDAIVFSSGANGTIFRVSPEGGQPEQVTRLDEQEGERSHLWPQFLSNGRDFIYITAGSSTRVVRQSLDEGQRSIVTELPASSTIRYASGHLFHVEDTVLWGQRFDEAANRLVGERRRLAAGIPLAGAGAAPFSISPSAVAYWTQSLVQPASELKWFDRRGVATTAVGDRAVYDGFDVSRDGSRLVSAEVGTGGISLWVRDLVNGGRFPLRLPAGTTVPVWAPDNRHIVAMNGGALYSIDVDARELAPVELTKATRNQLAQDWTPSGRQLIYENWNPDSGIDLVALDIETKQVTRLSWNTTANEFGARLSPDGQWILYVTDQAGEREVWIARYPSGEQKRRLSVSGGTHPAWGKKGREVYFISTDGHLVAMPLAFDASGAQSGPATNLFRMPGPVDVLAGSHNIYKPSTDGQRFLVSEKSAPVDVPPINIILNWPQLITSP